MGWTLQNTGTCNLDPVSAKYLLYWLLMCCWKTALAAGPLGLLQLYTVPCQFLSLPGQASYPVAKSSKGQISLKTILSRINFQPYDCTLDPVKLFGNLSLIFTQPNDAPFFFFPSSFFKKTSCSQNSDSKTIPGNQTEVTFIVFLQTKIFRMACTLGVQNFFYLFSSHFGLRSVPSHFPLFFFLQVSQWS